MSPNVAIISATIAVLTPVFAVFGASWLNQRNIEKLLEQLGNRFDARLDTLLAEMRLETKRLSKWRKVQGTFLAT